MPTCEWETILQGLQDYLTTQLRAAYPDNPDAFASCDLNAQDFQSIAAASTPAVAMWQQARTRTDPDVPSFTRRLKLIGIIRRTGSTAALLQTEGNYLERYLDEWFEDPLTIGGYSVTVYQAPNQQSYVFGGSEECWLDYDVTIRFQEAL